MANFFNGADSAEVAGLNTSSADLNILVKKVFSNPEVVDRCQEIIDDDSKGKLVTIAELTAIAYEEEPAIREYDLDALWPVMSRRLNTMTRTIAKNHGFKTYQKLVNGKVKKAELLEHK